MNLGLIDGQIVGRFCDYNSARVGAIINFVDVIDVDDVDVQDFTMG